MKDIKKKFHKDPETIESLKQFFRSSLKDDLPPVVELYIREMIDLVLAIAADEFRCTKCSTEYKMFGAELRNFKVERWI